MSDLISRREAIDRINKQREHLQPDIYPQDKIGDAAYRICAEFIERLPSAQPEMNMDELCTDCKEYDHEKHCCPRFNRVIRNALKDAQLEIIECKDCTHRGEKPIADGRYWCDIHDAFMYYCSDAERRTE